MSDEKRTSLNRRRDPQPLSRYRLQRCWKIRTGLGL